MNRLELMLNRGQVEVETFSTSAHRPEALEVSQHIDEYLKSGGKVQQIPNGVSGEKPFKPKRTQEEIRDQMRGKGYRKAGKA